MTPQLHAFLNALYLFTGAALLLAVAACIAALMLRHEQRRRAALAANGLTHWTTVSADEMQPFEESLRQVRVIDFEADQ